MKPKQALDIDALVAATVPPRPNPQLAFTMDVQVVSEANTREHWGKKFKRKKEQQDALRAAWKKAAKKLPRPVAVPCVVRFTRIGPQKLDDDNLSGGFKGLRDSVANELGIDDGSELVRWEYAQCAVGKRIYSVRVEVY